MEAVDVREMTYAEYLAFERASARRHEYVNGRVYAMAGGSPEHARLAGAMIAALTTTLRGKPCAPFSSDLPDAATNPAVIVEVLSETTERDDRGEKWAHYQRIASLREYVLLSQDSRRVEVYSRDEQQSDLWHYREYGTGGRVALPSLGITIDVDDVYANPLA